MAFRALWAQGGNAHTGAGRRLYCHQGQVGAGAAGGGEGTPAAVCAPTQDAAKKRVAVLLGEGSSEIELAVAVSLLRRAGLAALVTGVPKCEPLYAETRLVLCPDEGICDTLRGGPFDAVVVPGGREAVRILSASSAVGHLLKETEKCEGTVAAIGFAPLVLKAHRVMVGRCLTSHPCLREDLCLVYKWTDEKAVTDGRLVTASGPGAAFHFGLNLVEILVGQEKARELRKELLVSSISSPLHSSPA